MDGDDEGWDAYDDVDAALADEEAQRGLDEEGAEGGRAGFADDAAGVCRLDLPTVVDHRAAFLNPTCLYARDRRVNLLLPCRTVASAMCSQRTASLHGRGRYPRRPVRRRGRRGRHPAAEVSALPAAMCWGPPPLWSDSTVGQPFLIGADSSDSLFCLPPPAAPTGLCRTTTAKARIFDAPSASPPLPVRRLQQRQCHRRPRRRGAPTRRI